MDPSRARTKASRSTFPFISLSIRENSCICRKGLFVSSAAALRNECQGRQSRKRKRNGEAASAHGSPSDSCGELGHGHNASVVAVNKREHLLQVLAIGIRVRSPQRRLVHRLHILSDQTATEQALHLQRDKLFHLRTQNKQNTEQKLGQHRQMQKRARTRTTFILHFAYLTSTNARILNPATKRLRCSSKHSSRYIWATSRSIRRK